MPPSSGRGPAVAGTGSRDIVSTSDAASTSAAATTSAAVTVPSPSGIRVVDTTCAGDIFGGSAMSRFLKIGKAPGELSVDELTAVTRFACTAASLSTQKHGGISSVPDIAEVEAKLAE